jgi:hypothetical protein
VHVDSEIKSYPGRATSHFDQPQVTMAIQILLIIIIIVVIRPLQDSAVITDKGLNHSQCQVKAIISGFYPGEVQAVASSYT